MDDIDDDPSGGILLRNRASIFMLPAVMFAVSLFMGLAAGHAPSDVVLEYDFDSQVLSVTISHETFAPSTHYVETVTVFRNDVQVLQETYTSQPQPLTITYEYEVTAVDGDVLRVLAECSITGTMDEEITVQGDREYMELTVNPRPDELVYGEELDLTVNIYAVNDGTPLDGVTVVPDADLGYVGEVDELGLGGYGFTYEAPNPEDTEDIEVINLTCTKNGYHPLYFEFSFDLVLADDDSRDITVTINPVVYNMDEGAVTTFTVEVKAGEQYLDIPDIDVEYSKGKLSVDRTNPGRFQLTYTADQVDSDTTGYIRVEAEMQGYNPGSREIQFQIRDLGDVDVDEEPERFSIGGIIIFVIIAGAVIVLVLAVIYFIWKRGKKKEEEGDYEEVEIAQIVDEDVQR